MGELGMDWDKIAESIANPKTREEHVLAEQIADFREKANELRIEIDQKRSQLQNVERIVAAYDGDPEAQREWERRYKESVESGQLEKLWAEAAEELRKEKE